MLGDPEGEDEVAPLLLARVALGGHRHLVALLDVAVLVLDEDAAGDALVVELAGVDLPALLVAEDADVGLALQDLERRRLVAGREQHLDEQLGEALGERRRPRCG